MSKPAVHVDRRYIFATTYPGQKPAWEINERWIDLYALLEVAPHAPPEIIEDAIVSRGADCVLFAFARGGGKPEVIETVEAHLSEFRPILLDPETRRQYDRQLALHRAGDGAAQDYAAFVQSAVKLPESAGCLGAAIAMLCLALLPLGAHGLRL